MWLGSAAPGNRWDFGRCSEKRPPGFTRYVDKAQPIGGHGCAAASERVEMRKSGDSFCLPLDIGQGWL